ncbi:MAG: cofactor assembly of complex C subunit B [Synechocystis sp.]|nr:cofactor assembly of complex C subunit B [Synechocystis sp.]
MDVPVLGSTLLFTIFSLIGLVFFIRSSVKDRTQQLRAWIDNPESGVLDEVKTHFTRRAYRITHVDPLQQTITFEGNVQASPFLAVFLSLLAALGLLCLALVLSILFPKNEFIYFFLLWLAPLAGVFYWRKAQRVEMIKLEVGDPDQPDRPGQYPLTITAHRDELRQLQEMIKLNWQGGSAH